MTNETKGPLRILKPDERIELGTSIVGEVTEIWAVVGNTDSNEGRGLPIDRMYCGTQDGALLMAQGRGVFGNPADVEKRRALLTNIVCDGKPYYILLPGSAFVQLQNTDAAMRRRREELLSKMSAADRAVLGL